MRTLRSISVAIYIVGMAGAFGCAGDSTDPDNPSDEGSLAIAPGPLTLNVGGSATLSATVRDGAGAIVPSPVGWVTRNPLVAAINSSGTVTGLAVGQTMAVATAGARRDSVLVTVLDDLTLEVVPGVGSVQVGRTFQFSVVARNGAGQVIATPPVNWASSSVGIATVGGTGIATGVARGVASITASARGVTSTSGLLNVTDGSASCDGIMSVTEWSATLDYTYGVRGTSEGGFAINSDNKGNVTATLTAQVPQIEPLLIWKGKLSGTASLHETKSGTVNDVTKLDGEGPVLTIAGGYEPTMSLIVDTRTCTYKVTAVTTLSLRRTEPGGTTSTLEAPVATVQVSQTTPLGPWRTLNISDVSDTPYPGHSELWLGANPNQSGFAALGFATELTQRSFTEPPVGGASVSYAITRK